MPGLSVYGPQFARGVATGLSHMHLLAATAGEVCVILGAETRFSL